jgi:hypothetical protein
MLCLYSIPLMWFTLYRCKVRQKQKLDPPKALWQMVGMTNLFLVVGILLDSDLEELQLMLAGSQALHTKENRMVCMMKGGSKS